MCTIASLRFHEQLIASLLKPMEEHTEDARNEEDLSRLPVSPRAYYVLMAALIKYHQVKIAVRASLLANIALAVLQC
jgi:hypothetical protein